MKGLWASTDEPQLHRTALLSWQKDYKNTSWGDRTVHAAGRPIYFVWSLQASLHVNCGNVDVCFSAVNKSLLLLQWKSTLDLCMPRVENPPNDLRVPEWHFEKCKRSLIFKKKKKKINVSTADGHVIIYSRVILRFKDSWQRLRGLCATSRPLTS